LTRKHLEQICGFLQYVTQTYTSLTSSFFLFHMTINLWRPGLCIWIRWSKNEKLLNGSQMLFTPSGWFDNAHNDGNFFWTVSPAAAKVVFEQLGSMLETTKLHASNYCTKIDDRPMEKTPQSWDIWLFQTRRQICLGFVLSL
jgi:hypothetical protein